MARRSITRRVEIRSLAFQPAELEASAGDTVVWTNHDFLPHTVTDDAGRWDSGTIGPDRSWRLVVRAPGAYHCTFHPGMRGAFSVR